MAIVTDTSSVSRTPILSVLKDFNRASNLYSGQGTHASGYGLIDSADEQTPCEIETVVFLDGSNSSIPF